MFKGKNPVVLVAPIAALALILLLGAPKVIWDTYQQGDDAGLSQQEKIELQVGSVHDTGVLLSDQQDLLIGVQSLTDGIDFGRLGFCQTEIADIQWRKVKSYKINQDNYILARSKPFVKKSRKKKVRRESLLFISSTAESVGATYLLSGVKKGKLNPRRLKKLFDRAASRYCGSFGEAYHNRAAAGVLVPEDSDVNMPLEVEMQSVANGQQVFVKGLTEGEYQLYLGVREQGASRKSYRSSQAANWLSVSQVVVSSAESTSSLNMTPLSGINGGSVDGGLNSQSMQGHRSGSLRDDPPMPSYIKSLPDDSPLKNKYCNRKKCEWLDWNDLRRYSGSGPVMDDGLNDGKEKAQCSTDADCTYNKCEGDKCVSKAVFGGEGKEEDECVITDSYPEGKACIHSICKNNRCESQQGPGEVECSSHDECVYTNSGNM